MKAGKEVIMAQSGRGGDSCCLDEVMQIEFMTDSKERTWEGDFDTWQGFINKGVLCKDFDL